MKPYRHPARPSLRGVTLIELLIGIAVLGILLAMAAPGFGSWIAAYRLTVQSGDFTASLAYARSEAVRRGVRVVVCKSANPTAATPACTTNGSWNTGWLVYVDNVQVAGNVAGTIDGTDSVLRIGEPLQGAVVNSDSNLASWLAYTADGLAISAGGSAAGTITMCQGKAGQAIALNVLGRVATSKVGCA